jgi:hypothetical protein
MLTYLNEYVNITTLILLVQNISLQVQSLISGPVLISGRYVADSATHVENFPELQEFTKSDIPFTED